MPLPDSTRVRISPTRYGAFFMLVLLGMMLGSANYGNNLGFLVTFILAGMAAASILAGRGLLADAELHFSRAQPVFAGQQACFSFSLQTQEKAPAMELGFEDGEVVRLDMPTGKSGRASLCLQAPARGLFAPGAVSMATTSPLGLFRFQRVIETQARCLVYPAPAAGGQELQRMQGGAGAGGEGGPGVEEFKGLREYAPGDPMQRIAWKHSQRGQGLLTKEFEGRRGGAIVLDFDVLAPLGLEERLSRLCRMALEAHTLAEPFALWLPQQRIPAGAGEAHLRRCLKALALYGSSDSQADRQGGANA